MSTAITAIAALNSIDPDPFGKWTLTKKSFPEPGKWVLIRTSSYQRIARFENGVWRSINGSEETKPVISWQEL